MIEFIWRRKFSLLFLFTAAGALLAIAKNNPPQYSVLATTPTPSATTTLRSTATLIPYTPTPSHTPTTQPTRTATITPRPTQTPPNIYFPASPPQEIWSESGKVAELLGGKYFVTGNNCIYGGDDNARITTMDGKLVHTDSFVKNVWVVEGQAYLYQRCPSDPIDFGK